MTQASFKEPFALPEGRLINHSLFVPDVYVDPKTGKEGLPSYKVELAFDGGIIWPAEPGGELTLIDRILAAADEAFGPGTRDNEDLVIPILTGDKLAAKREAKGKEGDAYKGMDVVRANTVFNLHGERGPGGIQVFGPDVLPILPVNSAEIYRGCYGEAAITLDTYTDNHGNPAVTLYLKAFQKTRDGDRLVAQSDISGLFQNHGGAAATQGEAAAPAAPAAAGRRRR